MTDERGLMRQLREAPKTEGFTANAYSNAVGSFIGGAALLLVVALATLMQRHLDTVGLIVAVVVAGAFMVVLTYSNWHYIKTPAEFPFIMGRGRLIVSIIAGLFWVIFLASLVVQSILE